MRHLVNKAYWVYAVSSVSSLVLAFFVLASVNVGGALPYIRMFGPFNTLQVFLVLVIVTLIYGLFVAMPLLRQSKVQQDQLSARAAKLEVDVVTDPLTRLYNRRYFDDSLNAYLKEFKRAKAPLALLMLDLDHFKSVNDTHGHDAGDLVLQEVSKRLKSLTRGHDIVARTGGEEFCIVAPFSDVEQIKPFAERICKMVGELRVELGEVVLRPSISIGVATTAEGIKGRNALLKKADLRLYQAKADGRGRVCFG